MQCIVDSDTKNRQKDNEQKYCPNLDLQSYNAQKPVCNTNMICMSGPFRVSYHLLHLNKSLVSSEISQGSYLMY